MTAYKQPLTELHSIKKKLSIGALLNPQQEDKGFPCFITSQNSPEPSRIPPTTQISNTSLPSYDKYFYNQKEAQTTVSHSFAPHIIRGDAALSSYHHHILPTLSPSSLQLNPNKPEENEKISGQHCSTNRGRKSLGSNWKYEEEHMYFLWYHYVELHLNWDEILAIFHRQFPDIQRLNVEAIRQKLRRFVKGKGAPSPRMQRSLWEVEHTEMLPNSTDSSLKLDRKDLGLKEDKNVWYSWMNKDTSLPLAKRQTQFQNGLGQYGE
jgi:hypothetical protein